MPLPPPGRGICRGVPATAASVSSAEPGNVFAATSERKRNLFRFPRAGGVCHLPGPEADGLLRRACFAKEIFLPVLRRKAELARPLRSAELFRACQAEHGTSPFPGRDATRVAPSLSRGGGLFAPAGTRWPRFCRVLPEGGAQSAEASPFCASSDACEGRSVKMISARESSSRISSSTPGSTITPERGFLMLSTRVVMTA